MAWIRVRTQRGRVRRPPAPPARDPLVWPAHAAQVALTALALARDRGEPPSAAPRLVLAARALHSRQRRAAGDLLFEVLRLGARLDARISHAVAAGRMEPPRTPPARDAARVAALCHAEWGWAADQVGALTGLAPAAVEALGGTGFLAGLTGGARLATEHAMPAWLAERLLTERGEPFAHALLHALNQRAPLCLRAVPPRQAVLDALTQEGVSCEPTRWSDVGVRLHSHHNARALGVFRAGRVEVQDEGSQLIAAAVAPAAGELVVDACAGAGGKTLALAAAQPSARLLAVEPGRRRLDELRERARRARARVRTIHAGLEDAAVDGLLGQADAVLVDAPCSGTGTLRREPLNRWTYQPADITGFAVTQARLLARAVTLLRPGGRLIYATCSLLREENEAVVASALSSMPGLEPLPLTDLMGPVAEAAGASGHELRLWPHVHGTDGFYLAAVRRRPDGR